MIRHRYYVGTVTKDGLPVSDEQRAKLRKTLCDMYNGYTVYRVGGAWRDVWGTIKVEQSEVYEGLAPRPDVDPQALAMLLAQLAEQSTVLWTKEKVTGGFSA